MFFVGNKRIISIFPDQNNTKYIILYLYVCSFHVIIQYIGKQ